jgi:hypothetical protein
MVAEGFNGVSPHSLDFAGLDMDSPLWTGTISAKGNKTALICEEYVYHMNHIDKP